MKTDAPGKRCYGGATIELSAGLSNQRLPVDSQSGVRAPENGYCAKSSRLEIPSRMNKPTAEQGGGSNEQTDAEANRRCHGLISS